MKNKSRIVLLILAILILLASLCACTAGKSEEELRSDIKKVLFTEATAEVMTKYNNVNGVSAVDIASITESGENKYSVYGEIIVNDNNNNRYYGDFEARMSLDDDGDVVCDYFYVGMLTNDESTGNDGESYSKEDNAEYLDELIVDAEGKQLYKVYIHDTFTIDADYTGDGNFIIWLLDGNQEEYDLLCNEIGTYKLSTSRNVPDGFYYIKIEWSDGSWEAQWQGTYQ